MSIKHCRVCGKPFDCKGAANAKTREEHRMTAAKSQALYYSRMKGGNTCRWCGNYAADGVEFCRDTCKEDALRYRAFLKREEEKILMLKNKALDNKVV